MQTIVNRINFSLFLIIIACSTFSCKSSDKWVVPANLIGDWKSKTHKITVRTEPKWMKFEFTSDSVTVFISINEDKTANGNIGLASFNNAIVEENSGNPSVTGISYIVKCGKIGKIFNNDPLDNKEVEIWLSPIENNMKAEIRYSESGDKFPMAGLVFEKVVNK
jgi:hypothetical protein